MFEFLQIHSTEIQSLITIIVIVAYGLEKLFSNSGKLRKEIIDEYKERNDQLSKKVDELTDTCKKFELDMTGIRATLTEKDKQLTDFKEIFANRNPELINILNEIKEGNIQVQTFMKIMNDKLNKSSSELGYQTRILEKNQERQAGVDQASVSHEGEIMRVPTSKKAKRKK